MKEITFKYRDYLCNDHKWRTRDCIVETVNECIRIYGLDDRDVEYEILEVKEME